MAFQLASIIETTAFQFLDEMLAQFNSDDGFARTNRWELIITLTGGRGNNLKVVIF